MYLGENIRKLGFGLMRLPQKDGVIDVEQVKVMVDKFLAAGFTYFDTAWAYPGSEDAIRQALVERYPREKFQLATKNAAWVNCKTREDAVAQFETSLKQTGAGYFDFYLLHNLGESRTKFFDDFDMWSFVQEKKKEGKIRHVGFSFHSTPEELEEILKAHPEMEFVQLQINYGDWENPAIQSRACYETARKYDKPVSRGAGILLRVVGGAVRREPRRADHGAFRYVQRRADGGQSFVHEGFQKAHAVAGGNHRKGAGSAGENPDHPLHHLQLLREGLPAEHRRLRLVHRDELPDAVRRQRRGEASGKLAREHARQKARGGLREMRRL